MTIALVTGATGFIGGRLVEELVLRRGWKVRALVRDFSRAVRIGRFDIEMVHGDVSDATVLRQAVEGCDLVFHCAYDFRKSAANIDAAGALARACRDAAVGRLVHVSSISVYQPLPDGVVDENAPAEPCGWDYADAKLAVERRLLEERVRHDLPVVIVQPTVVYGPFGGMWTAGVIERLRDRIVVLPERGEGVCNAVYIDDVVAALLAAAETPSVVGERFLISGPDSVTWGEFYGAFERLLGVRSLLLVGEQELARIARAGGTATVRVDPARSVRSIASLAVRRGAVRRVLRPVKRIVGRRWVTAARRALPSPRPLAVPEGELLALYRARAHVDIAKARSVLGYEPRFDFERGMARTEAFLRWAGLLPAPEARPAPQRGEAA